jgi:hypothetical protein
MADALTAARDMGLPAAAIARLARLASVSMDDAEVLAARLVQDLRDAGWIAVQFRPGEYTPIQRGQEPPVDPRMVADLRAAGWTVEAPDAPVALRAVDPRVARALTALARLWALHLCWPERDDDTSNATLSHVHDLIEGKIE